MDNYINVREILGIEERRPSLLFDPVGPDRHEAMDRYKIIEQIMQEWKLKLNGTNTRLMTTDLQMTYDNAFEALIDVWRAEKAIIQGRAE